MREEDEPCWRTLRQSAGKGSFVSPLLHRHCRTGNAMVMDFTGAVGVFEARMAPTFLRKVLM